MHHHCHSHGWHGAGRRGPGHPGPGHGPFRRGFGGGSGGPFGRGKMIGDGDLKLVVLALLAEAPRHGYDVIKALEERSQGAYSPSPGVVYPTLTFLEEAGYAESASEGARKVFSITEEGRKHLADNRAAADGVLDGMARYGEKLAKARAWFYRQDDGGASDIPGVVPEVNEARRALRAAIAATLDAPAETQRGMAGILREAASAIRALAPEDGGTDAG